MSKIGIVTVLYNSEKVLPEFFETLDQQDFKDFTLYVIDNASPDKSLEITEKLSKEVSFKTVFLPQKENWGVAKGNNIGIKEALKDNCEYILLANNDIVLNPDTISQLLKGIEKYKVTIAVPKIYFHDSGLIWYAGGRFSYLKGTTPHRGSKKNDLGKFDKPKLTEYAPTCFMLIKSYVFKRIGLMDEKYFVYYDDSDFIWRATIKGKEKIIYYPFSFLRHKESSSTRGYESNFSLYYINRNKKYFCLKNMKFPQKQITLCLNKIHTMIRKPFVYNKDQLKLIKKAEKDGIRLYKQ